MAPAWTVGLSDPERFTFRGDLSLPSLADPPQEGDERVCTLERVNHHKSHNTTAGNLRDNNMNDGNDTNDCPGEPGSPDHAILPGDIILSDDELTIDQLVVEGSVTVYSEGDIIVCGDIEATGTNPAGGPNVIALITAGDVILDPSGLTPLACADDTLLELNTSHNLTLTNVAVLAPDGAVYARRWHLPHASAGGPTLTIEGSIAAEHLGLYGIPDQATGTITSGWAKTFIYPTDFWQARPPWWPDFTGNEWAPVGTPAASSGEAAPEPEPEPGFNINPTAVTVTEGSASIASFEVRLATQPSEDVTVNVRLHPSPVLLVTPAALTFTPGNWDTAQAVDVNASSYQDADVIPLVGLQVELAAVSTDGDYGRFTAQVDVTVEDDDSHDLPDLIATPGSLSIAETGSATFTVSLTTQPSSDVTVNIASDDPTTVTVTPTPLIFTPGNWATAQTVTVTGVNDADTSDEALSVTLSTTSTDIDYDTTTASVAVTVTDDDTAALVVSQNSVTVDENGTATFDVSLATQPTGSVTVSVTSADPAAVTADPDSLTFTTTDWDAAQTVTVTGTDDADTSNDTATITLTSMSADSDYDSLTAAVAVTTADDDGVDVLTVTCDAAAQTITIQWPELEADRVQISGRSGVTADWYDVTGSIVTVSTEGLADWLIQYGNGQWELQWGEQPDDWGNGWGGFFPAGRELTVYVWPNHNSGDTFPCP